MHRSTGCVRKCNDCAREYRIGRLTVLMAEKLCCITTPHVIKLHWLQMGVRVELKIH